MDKMKMHTPDITESNIEKIGQLFPNCLTERIGEDGKVEKAIDFDLLRQELSKEIVEGPQERYQFTWPDKKKAIRLANTPSTMTLRPCREESVDFDNTENLYIEGDNLEVLKLLREDYLGKVKMIYIDPPYNTGNDFVYEDDFSQSASDYAGTSGQTDASGNRLVQNTESNGRFHTDWLNMMYPRLRIAKDLLSNDGVIFISIDDNELHNLLDLCYEVFGRDNFVGNIVWSKKRKGSFLSKGIISLTEYLVVFCKNSNSFGGLFGGQADASESQPIIKRTNNRSTLAIPENLISTKLPDGTYNKGVYGDDVNPVELLDDVIVKDGLITNAFRITAPFIWTQKMFNDEIAKGGRAVINTLNFQIRVFRVVDENSFKGFASYIDGVQIKGTNEDAYEELIRLFGVKKLFDYSKPVSYIKLLAEAATHFSKDAIILDFFSGSGTTAQAIMKLNQEDGGGRRFIMIQLPEETDPNSDAFKAGYQNICEIGKERIRRAGKRIQEEQDQVESDNGLFSQSNTNSRLDTGFRVLKLDSSNMEDVYYRPEESSEATLFETNVKEGRSSEDLLFQVMLECNLPLSAQIETEKIAGKEVFTVNNGYLIACFDEDVNEEVIKAVAKRKPYYFIMRDSSLASDNVADNFEQIFQAYSKDTIRRIL